MISILLPMQLFLDVSLIILYQSKLYFLQYKIFIFFLKKNVFFYKGNQHRTHQIVLQFRFQPLNISNGLLILHWKLFSKKHNLIFKQLMIMLIVFYYTIMNTDRIGLKVVCNQLNLILLSYILIFNTNINLFI